MHDTSTPAVKRTVHTSDCKKRAVAMLQQEGNATALAIERGAAQPAVRVGKRRKLVLAKLSRALAVRLGWAKCAGQNTS